MAWTTPTSQSTGALITASTWNTDLVNNLAYLKASPTFDGIVTANGFGIHSFTSGGAGTNRLLIENTTSGVANTASLRVTAGTSNVFLFAYSQGYTPGTSDLANGAELLCTSSGGLSIRASAGTVRIYGTATLAATFAAAGVTIPGTLDVTGTSTLGAVTVGTTLGVTGVATFTAQPVMLAGASVRGAEGGNATLELWADEGDDSADKWSLVAQAGANGLYLLQDATTAIIINWAAAGRGIQTVGGAFGTGAVGGTFMVVDRNTSGGGAPGYYQMQDKGGTGRLLWTDSTGVVRIHTAVPTETAGDTIGTVVGTQTSTRASKDITGKFTENAKALRTILKTPLWKFRYKSGAYNHQRFVGITTDDSPIFGMDKGRSFNPVTTAAYLMAAVKELARKLDTNERKLAALQARHA